jgi:hypothetical protein
MSNKKSSKKTHPPSKLSGDQTVLLVAVSGIGRVRYFADEAVPGKDLVIGLHIRDERQVGFCKVTSDVPGLGVVHHVLKAGFRSRRPSR